MISLCEIVGAVHVLLRLVPGTMATAHAFPRVRTAALSIARFLA